MLKSYNFLIRREKMCNKCSIENCELDEYLEGKCILHCDKYDWDDILRKRNLFWRKLTQLNNQGYFKERDSGQEIRDVVFPAFEFKRIIKRFKKGVTFFRCKFQGKIYQRESSFSEKYIFSRSVFEGDVKFIYTDFSNQLVFINKTVFKKNLTFTYCTFKKNVIFNYVNFNRQSIFGFSSFEQNLSLSDVEFSSKLNLAKTIIHGKLKLNNSIVDVRNYQTARIIKDSYEQQNNIIEANRYYALEMKEYDKELTWKDDFKEKLVFKLHEWSSEHSQNWTLPLFWILFFSMLYALFEHFFICKESIKESFAGLSIAIITFPFILSNIIENQNFKKYFLSFIFLVLGIYIFITADYLWENPAKAINPFSIMQNEEDINGIELLFKIIIAYLIYQFIISIRQNTRRK